MDSQFYRPGNNNGFQYVKQNDNPNETKTTPGRTQNTHKKDEDLVIEENTIYEIDRDCYERLKRQKKRK